MIKRLSILLLALLAWSTPAAAQVLDVGSITANSSGGGCTGTANSCASFSLANGAISSVTLAVSGTFTGTLTFEGTSDNSTWFTLSGTKLADGSSATTTTATGQFSFNNSGLLGVRARATAAMTGTAVVTAARGYAVARWLTPFLSSISVGDGTANAPSYSFTSDLTTGLFRNGNLDIGVSLGGTTLYDFKNTGLNLASTMIFSWASDTQLARAAAGVLTASGASGTNGIRLQFNGLPVVGTCGTSPAITAGSRDTAGSVNVGTGGTATSCTVTFNATWASAPFCTANGTTTTAANVRAVAASATTTVLTLTAATAWAASDVVAWTCVGAK